MSSRVALYARYSSDLQRKESVEDQLRVCRERAERDGWTVVESYSDRAISGASLLRPGIQALIEDANSGKFDIVLAEAMDRLSRDQEDIAALFKRLLFAGVQIVTIAEGDVSEIHVGLKGTMNALFLKDLAQKTHRGLRGRIEAGKAASGKSFGYDIVRTVDARGEPVRGERAINPAEAAVVQRIFTMTAAGASPIVIAKQLNAEGVPGVDGRPWGDTTVRGHALRGTGILRNELYIGRLIWNRMRFIKDPVSGKRVSRMNPRDQWITEDVPDLRIVEQDLWDLVQTRLSDVRLASGADAPGRPKFHERRRAQHILTGKVFCATCGGMFGAVGKDYLACTAARRQGTCTNGQSLRRDTLEELILDALKHKLMRPDYVEQFITEFTAEWNRLQATIEANHASLGRELNTITRKLKKLIDAISEGYRSSTLQQELDVLEARRTTLIGQLQNPARAAPRMHPNLAGIYRERVENLHTALASPDGGRESLEAVRSLIERIDVGTPKQNPAVGDVPTITHDILPEKIVGRSEAAPTDTQSPDLAKPRRAGRGSAKLPDIVLTGAIASMVELAMGYAPKAGVQHAMRAKALRGDGSDLFLSSVKVVAGARNHRELTLRTYC